jgi:ATP-dependent Zn protease
MARSGFSSNYGRNSYDGENLAVVTEGYCEKNNDQFRIEAIKFIQMQYSAVKVILNSNKLLLVAIKNGLVERRLLLKRDLEALVDELAISHKKAA